MKNKGWKVQHFVTLEKHYFFETNFLLRSSLELEGPVESFNDRFFFDLSSNGCGATRSAFSGSEHSDRILSKRYHCRSNDKPCGSSNAGNTLESFENCASDLDDVDGMFAVRLCWNVSSSESTNSLQMTELPSPKLKWWNLVIPVNKIISLEINDSQSTIFIAQFIPFTW